MSPFWQEGLLVRAQEQEAQPGQFFWQWRWHPISDVLYRWRVHTH